MEQRIKPPAPLVEWFDAGREQELVERLLEDYYDPLYRRSERHKSYQLSVDASDPARAAAEIAEWIAGRTRERVGTA